MYCKNCGKQIDDNSIMCVHCGAVVNDPTTIKKTNTMSIVGFILSFIIPIVGLICSIMGLKKADTECGGKGKGLAIAGIIISILNWVLGFIISFNMIMQGQI